MRILKKIELFGQLLLLASAGFFALASTIENDYLYSLAIVQFIIGVEQYFSSLVTVVAEAGPWKQKRIHLSISTVYLITLLAGASLEIMSSPIALVYLFGLPWILAIYYFALTWKWNFPTRTNNGHFLPHTSF